jgi:BirA family biotin operon repressor/biotin-[acetyl-CoA-carboxylase] ligase
MRADPPALPRGYRLLCYDAVDSSNDEAKRLARNGAVEGTVVWAREQTAGRGRRGRLWVSPPGNLYASLILRPLESPARAAQLGFATALALGEALGALLPAAVDLRCKWPNDVLVNGRKLAGILLESETAGAGVLDFLVIGVGVNLASSPPEVEFPATSVAAEGVAIPAPGEVLAGFIHRFDRWLRRWRAQGFAAVRAAWLQRAMPLGGDMVVRLDGATLRGRFRDIDADGALMLDDGGVGRRVAAGEVFPARS